MGTTVGTVTVLTVGVVKGDAVDSDAVVTVLTSGVVAVVCDSVVNVVGLKVLSVAKRRSPQYIKTASPPVLPPTAKSRFCNTFRCFRDETQRALVTHIVTV